MSMYDEIGNIDESAAGGGGNYKMPLGTHPALISDLVEDNDKKVVDFKLNFLGTSVAPKARFWLGGDDPVKVKKGHAMISKQLKSVLGRPITNGKEMGQAIRELEGKYVLVDVTNRKGNADYQNYWLSGPYTPPRASTVEPGGSTSTDDLPF